MLQNVQNIDPYNRIDFSTISKVDKKMLQNVHKNKEQ